MTVLRSTPKQKTIPMLRTEQAQNRKEILLPELSETGSNCKALQEAFSMTSWPQAL